MGAPPELKMAFTGSTVASEKPTKLRRSSKKVNKI